MGFKGLACIFVCLCVSLDHFGFALLVNFVGFVFFSVPSKEIGWEERLEMIYFVSIGTWNLAPSIYGIFLIIMIIT